MASGGMKREKGIKMMVEADLTLGGEHMMQYANGAIHLKSVCF